MRLNSSLSSGRPGTSRSATRAARPTTVMQGGRAKAYRPIPPADRTRAFEEALAAYERGDYFEAHEDLEPAWMGTDDLGERAYLQGLIKLAAAYVHGVRGNPAGISRNLNGARARLAEALETGGGAAADLTRIDLPALISEIERRLTDLADHPNDPSLGPPDLQRTVP